ncbi:peroxiredoxin family protein [Methylophaga lonarensis]|uniref:peroxiredoxin family protein n=1 Tax=Methylophaga lonarensis TaxID=999151 RepID=UPI003D2E789F
MKSTSRLLTYTVSIALLLFLVFWFRDGQGPKMPDISFTDIDGQTHQLADYLGQPVLMIFWATDCPGCIQEIPDLQKLYADYVPQGLSMLSIALPHDTPEHLKAMRAERSLPYAIVWDQDGSIGRAFDNVRVTPTHFLIAPNGEIVMRKIGVLDRQVIENRLNRMGLQPA